MAIAINADEFLAIAAEVRHNGIIYYRHLADYAEYPESRKVLLELADIQKALESKFTDMRSKLSDEQRATTHFHPGSDEWMYLAQIADKNVYDISRDPCEFISSHDQAGDVLKAAAKLEKDSIVFFLELKRHVLSRDRSEMIDNVIRDSLSHLFWISARIGSIKAEFQLIGIR